MRTSNSAIKRSLALLNATRRLLAPPDDHMTFSATQPGSIARLAPEATAGFLRDVPEAEREARLQEAREQLGQVLRDAPIQGDPEVAARVRTEIARAFGVTYDGQ